MRSIVHFPSFAFLRAPLARLGPALAASALMHLALLSAPLLDPPWRGMASYPGDAPITVRLAPVPIPVPDVATALEPEVRRMARRPEPLAGSAESVRREFSSSGVAQTGTEVLALPRAFDTNYYTARDLDRYPRALAPFQINRTVGDGAGELRLEILIDEHGIVQDMSFAGSAAPARVEEELRAALAATRFLPAQKDGRAVRSRIVLSVGPGPGSGDR